MKKIRCKLCPAEFELDRFEDLQFHFAQGHAETYHKQVHPMLIKLNNKVGSYEFLANEGMCGYLEESYGTIKNSLGS